jgi:hypothetical protein
MQIYCIYGSIGRTFSPDCANCQILFVNKDEDLLLLLLSFCITYQFFSPLRYSYSEVLLNIMYNTIYVPGTIYVGASMYA